MASADIAIPVLPPAHGRALELLGDDDAELDELAAVVSSDPSMTLAVLRAANSAASASRARIEAPYEAVVRLGLGSTRRLIAARVLEATFPDPDAAGVNGDQLWEHLIACAMLAEAATGERQLKSAAFTAGLLHDIGRLALAAARPEAYARVAEAVGKRVEPLRAEQLLLRTDHQEFGARVATEWDLPLPIRDVIENHHGPTAGPLGAAVASARAIGAEIGIPDGLPPRPKQDGVGADGGRASAAAEALRSLGGESGLRTRIGWYRHASAAA